MHFAQKCVHPDNALLRKGVPKGVVERARYHLPVMAGLNKVSWYETMSGQPDRCSSHHLSECRAKQGEDAVNPKFEVIRRTIVRKVNSNNAFLCQAERLAVTGFYSFSVLALEERPLQFGQVGRSKQLQNGYKDSVKHDYHLVSCSSSLVEVTPRSDCCLTLHISGRGAEH
jgi:hypothetical protein